MALHNRARRGFGMLSKYSVAFYLVASAGHPANQSTEYFSQ